MLHFISEHLITIVEYLATFLIGLLAGGVHGLWCLHTYIPVLTALSLLSRNKLAEGGYASKMPVPPRRADFKWFLTSLFGTGGAASVAASYLGGRPGVGLYFIGLFLGFAPILVGLLFRLLILLAPLALIALVVDKK